MRSMTVKSISALLTLFSLLALLASSASAQVSGITVTDGATTCRTASTENFTAGATVTCNGRTANLNVVGAGGTVTSVDCTTGLTCTPDPIVGAGTVAVDQSFGFSWTGAQSWTQPLTLTGASASGLFGSTSATYSTFFGNFTGSALRYSAAAAASAAGARWSIIGQAGGASGGAAAGGAGAFNYFEGGAGGAGSGMFGGGNAGAAIFARGGNGGAGTAAAAAGNGGGYTFLGGTGGTDNGAGGGLGGGFSFTGGAGAAGSGAGGAAGSGGSFSVTGGTGGAASAAVAANSGGSASVLGGAGGAGSAAQAAGAGGHVTIRTGGGGTNNGGGGASSGDLTIDTGAATGAAVNGAILVGTANAESVTVGRSGKTVAANGTWTFANALTPSNVQQTYTWYLDNYIATQLTPPNPLDEEAFAQVRAATTLATVQFWPNAALTANNTDYVTITLYKRSAGVQTAIASVNTKTAGSGGSGNWTAWTAVPFTISAGSVASGDVLTVAWVQTMAGVQVPGGILVAY